MSIICPPNCLGILPPVEFSRCNPNIRFGEISYIFIMSKNGSAFTDVADEDEWIARLSDTDITNTDKIRTLIVSGETSIPERSEINITRTRKITAPKNFTLNIEVEDVTDNNYDFFRQLTGCNISVKMWYISSGYIFGGNSGIKSIANMGYKIDKGNKTCHKLLGTIRWDDKFYSQRNDSPFEIKLIKSLWRFIIDPLTGDLKTQKTVDGKGWDKTALEITTVTDVF